MTFWRNSPASNIGCIIPNSSVTGVRITDILVPMIEANGYCDSNGMLLMSTATAATPRNEQVPFYFSVSFRVDNAASLEYWLRLYTGQVPFHCSTASRTWRYQVGGPVSLDVYKTFEVRRTHSMRNGGNQEVVKHVE